MLHGLRGKHKFSQLLQLQAIYFTDGSVGVPHCRV